jgi:hypothetical protein
MLTAFIERMFWATRAGTKLPHILMRLIYLAVNSQHLSDRVCFQHAARPTAGTLCPSDPPYYNARRVSKSPGFSHNTGGHSQRARLVSPAGLVCSAGLVSSLDIYLVIYLWGLSTWRIDLRVWLPLTPLTGE